MSKREKETRQALTADSIALSNKGWMNNFICNQWFEQSFVPQAKVRNHSRKQIFLIFDGHHLHETPEIWEMVL